MKVVRSSIRRGADSQSKKLVEIGRERRYAVAPESTDSAAQGGSVAEDMDQVVSMLGEMDVELTDAGDGEVVAGGAEKQAVEEWPEEQPEVEEEGRRKLIAVGRMVHAAYDTPWGCELRSHFWLGHVESDLLGGLVQLAGNTPWFRRRAVSRADAYALEAHCHEEMTTLGSFLPGLFASEGGNE